MRHVLALLVSAIVTLPVSGQESFSSAESAAAALRRDHARFQMVERQEGEEGEVELVVAYFDGRELRMLTVGWPSEDSGSGVTAFFRGGTPFFLEYDDGSGSKRQFVVRGDQLYQRDGRSVSGQGSTNEELLGLWDRLREVASTVRPPSASR